jgi:ketosteroid isomerase-like protein
VWRSPGIHTDQEERVKPIFSAAILALALAPGLHAQTAKDAALLTRLLNEFLAGVSRNDAAVHERFWADDLVYTRSAGTRMGKKEILEGARKGAGAASAGPASVYAAEDIRIQQYGDTAVVAFRLVGTTGKAGKTEVAKYLDTGTFLKRNGTWQVVSWQATRMARPEEDARREVLEAQTALHQAILAADVKTLESLMDETFIWTHRTGEQQTRQVLLDQLASGTLRYSKLETNSVTVSVYGDTAVVRGVSPRQRSVFIGAPTGDPSPFTAFYTLTFANKGEGWKAVALHSSRTEGR